MNEILIDGVRYVPEFGECHYDDKLKTVLDSKLYLSDNAKEEIIADFKKETSVKLNNQNNISSRKRLYKIENIEGFDEMGHALFSQGRYKKSVWTMHQVIDIQSMLKIGKDINLTDLSKKYGISDEVIASLIFNIQYGDFPSLIDRWLSMNIDSNPFKR